MIPLVTESYFLDADVNIKQISNSCGTDDEEDDDLVSIDDDSRDGKEECYFYNYFDAPVVDNKLTERKEDGSRNSSSLDHSGQRSDNHDGSEHHVSATATVVSNSIRTTGGSIIFPKETNIGDKSGSNLQSYQVKDVSTTTDSNTSPSSASVDTIENAVVVDPVTSSTAPKCSRVGANYQAVIPPMLSCRELIAQSGVQSELIWCPDHISECAIDALTHALLLEGCDKPSLKPGTFVYASVAALETTAKLSDSSGTVYRLCCVVGATSTSSSSARTIHIFDGNKDYMLPHPEDNPANYNPWKPIFLRPFVSKHIEELMNSLHANDYDIEQTLNNIKFTTDDSTIHPWSLLEGEHAWRYPELNKLIAGYRENRDKCYRQAQHRKRCQLQGQLLLEGPGDVQLGDMEIIHKNHFKKLPRRVDDKDLLHFFLYFHPRIDVGITSLVALFRRVELILKGSGGPSIQNPGNVNTSF